MPEGQKSNNENPFPYSDTNKRYHTQSYYLKQRFGCKVMKIPLAAARVRAAAAFALKAAGNLQGREADPCPSSLTG